MISGQNSPRAEIPERVPRVRDRGDRARPFLGGYRGPDPQNPRELTADSQRSSAAGCLDPAAAECWVLGAESLLGAES